MATELSWYFDPMRSGWVVQISDGWRHVKGFLTEELLVGRPREEVVYDFLVGLAEKWRQLTEQCLTPVRPQEGQEWGLSDIIEGEVVEEREAICAPRYAIEGG